MRATLARDHRGPTVTLRLLPDHVSLDRLGLDLGDWLDRSGLIVIAGAAGAGKTVTLAALVGAVAAKRRQVIAIENPIEIVHASPTISQRELGAHVVSFEEGVANAVRESADCIAIGGVASTDAAAAVISAACGGGLVVTTVVSPSGGLAVERLVELCGADRRDFVRGVLAQTLLGTILPTPSRSGRTFEVNRPGERRA